MNRSISSFIGGICDRMLPSKIVINNKQTKRGTNLC